MSELVDPLLNYGVGLFKYLYPVFAAFGGYHFLKWVATKVPK